jgi:hypothetical protein
MKFTLVRCGAALLTATGGKPAMAQFTGPDAYNKNAASKVMRDDPAVATQIRQNPSLLNDPAYMRTHPNLSNFVAKNPSAVPYLTGGFYRPTGAMGDPRNFSQWMYNHPDINREFESKPDLATNQEYLEHHPEWREYLEHHTEIREHFEDHNWRYRDWYQHHQWKDRDNWYKDRQAWWQSHEAQEHAAREQKEYQEPSPGHHDNGHHYGWYKHHDHDDH